MKIESNQLLIKALQKEIELAEEQKLEFSKRELSKKAVSQDLLIKKLRKDILEKEIELKKIKDTPNAALEIANKKIQELELASKNKKEQEDKISILDKDNLKLQGDILKERTDRVNTWDYLWNVISNIAVKLFSEDFSFQEVVDRIKEDFFDKKGVISYQDHNNQKKDLIVEIVSDVADKIELDKKTVKSKENGRQ